MPCIHPQSIHDDWVGNCVLIECDCEEFKGCGPGMGKKEGEKKLMENKEVCENPECEAVGEPVPHSEHAPKKEEKIVLGEGEIEPPIEGSEDEDTTSLIPDAPFAYLGGPAGSGKSTLLRELAKKDPTLLMTSTTGIAAINLGGTTINSALGYFDTNDLEDAYTKGYLQAKLRRLLHSGIRRLVIDEVSMMDGKQLTLITRAVDEVNSGQEALWDEGWALQVLLVGDFAQLPPVKAPFAFESPEWKRYSENQTLLTKIHRQANPEFIEALRCARRGDGRGALKFFEGRLEKQIDRDYDGPMILAKNDEVDRMNRLRLDECKGDRASYPTQLWGKPRGEWKQIPEILELKIGAKVMILSNKRERDEEGFPTGKFLYVNGDLGELVEKGDDLGPKVKLQRGDKVVTVEPVLRQNVIPLKEGRLAELTEQGLLSRVKYVRDKTTGRLRAEWEVIGEISYTPLRLAYATTVHKVQGLSLDKVQINISNPFFANPGSIYVALSRARNAEGLRLVAASPEQFVMRCKADPRVKEYL